MLSIAGALARRNGTALAQSSSGRAAEDNATESPKKKLAISGHYFRSTKAFNGRSRDEPPTRNVYSPGNNCQASRPTLKMERYHGSMSIVTSLLSPGSSLTLLHPTNRFGGSPALAGKAAYTSAISAPAFAPVFAKWKVNRTLFPEVSVRSEYL